MLMDLIYISTNQRMIKDFKRFIRGKFEMTGLGLINYFFGMQVKKSPG